MSVRKRPTRAGERRMRETGCKVADLPSSEISWLADYRDRAGERRFKTFTTQREAKDWLASAVVGVRQGTHVAESTMPSLAAAAEAWIKRGEADKRERSTIEQRRQHVDLHILPLLGDIKLSKIDVDGFRDELLRTRSRALAKKVMTSLKMILKQHRVTHLAAHVEPIVTGGRHKRRLEIGRDIPAPDEITALWPHASGYTRALVAVLIFCGLRMSEVRALRWQDLELVGKKPYLHVRQRVDKWQVVGVLKSETSYRSIPLIQFAVNALEAWRGDRILPGDALVFGNGRGHFESQGNIWNRRLSPVQVAAGLAVQKIDKHGRPAVDPRDGKPVLRGKYGPHSFRHFFASWRIAQGDDIETVREYMGHSSAVVTLSLYTHLMPKRDGHKRFAAGAAALVA